MSTNEVSIKIRKPNQHGASVLIDGVKRYTLRPGDNGLKVDPVQGFNLIDLNGNTFFHLTRDDALKTILWWHWGGGLEWSTIS